MRPFGVCCLRADRCAFPEIAGRPFLMGAAKAVNPQKFQWFKYTVHFIFMARASYILFMKQKKPGYPKGKTHAEIPRSVFGERLYKTRKARGLSQTALGKRVGLSQRMLSYYEGEPAEGPPISTLTKIAEALNVTVSYLLGESTLKAIKETTSPSITKHARLIEQLPPKDRKKVVEYIGLLAEKNSRD